MAIGRVANISPRQTEHYHLRLLLLNVPSATSFDDLRTVDGVCYDTYKKAAFARGLIEDDREWFRCMEEAVVYAMPYQLRSLFVTLLIFCEVASPVELWEHFRPALIEDFIHRGHNDATATTMALLEIQAELERNGLSCADKGLPVPEPLPEEVEPTIVDAPNHAAIGEELLQMLNEGQRAAADAILAAAHSNNYGVPNCFFVDGPGGTGKTFLYIALIHVLRGAGKRVFAVAWTGIAANLLPGGQTCHTGFRLPSDLQCDSTCRLTKREKGRLLQTDVILWDEASMADKFALETVDRALRDITQNDNVPFGGKVIMLSGNFRQVIPVVPGASPLKIIAKCVKSSDLWRHFHQFRLTVNMRANADEIVYAQWLLALGEGRLPPLERKKTDYSVAVPAECVCEDVVMELFPDGFNGADVSTHQTVVLTPCNEDARRINERILTRLEGERVTYKSIDRARAAEGEDENTYQQMYPVEFLNTLHFAGLPPHELNLKKNAVVMLIRNLSVSRGLCNGTRLVVEDLQQKVIKARIIGGVHAGTVHFNPRVTLDTKDLKEVPFHLRRRQFPVKLGYSMTINKAQGQTLEKVGVYLRNPVFTHGQFYVACSRVRSVSNLNINVVDTNKQGKQGDQVVTDNIVFKEVL